MITHPKLLQAHLVFTNCGQFTQVSPISSYYRTFTADEYSITYQGHLFEVNDLMFSFRSLTELILLKTAHNYCLQKGIDVSKIDLDPLEFVISPNILVEVVDGLLRIDDNAQFSIYSICDFDKFTQSLNKILTL